MIVIDDIEQGTEEWFRLKAGVPGASSFNKIVTTTGDRSTQRNAYLYKLVGEKLLGVKEIEYEGWDMRRGLALEPEARETYEFVTGEPVRQVGFVYKDENRVCGCSPDGLLERSSIRTLPSGLEIKCPNLSNHTWHMAKNEIPYDKYCQIQGSMWVCGFHTWSFMSYYPGLKPVIIEVKRDYKFTSALEYEMEEFLKELGETYEKIRREND